MTTSGEIVPDGRSRWREHLPFIAAATVCVLTFGWMLTFGSGRLFEGDSFGDFYDYQAQGWLHGRWDVPEPALGGEAFVVNGKFYGYFGPTPALMRLPLIALGAGFGRLTRACMLLDYVACLVASYLILRHAARLASKQHLPPALSIIITAAVGLGSTLFYLGSRAYVYHEAILCGVAFSLWAVWGALQYANSGRTRWSVASLALGVLAVQARPPVGLFALTLLGCVALTQAFTHRRLAPLGVAAAAGIGVLSFNAVGYLKFGVFDGCPLRFHVQYTPERLAAIGGKNFHLSNVRFNADSYFWRSNVTVDRHLPFVHLDYLNRTKEYPESKIDYRDPTLALPYAMPALALLSLGSPMAFLLVRDGTLRKSTIKPIALIWIAAIPVTIAMLTAAAVTQRYTADFCPFLITAAAFGGALVTMHPAWRYLKFVLLGIACANVLSEAAITLHEQRAVVWGVPAETQQQYQAWCRRIDFMFGAK